MSLSRCGSTRASDGFVLVEVLATCHGPLAVGAGADGATALVRIHAEMHCAGGWGRHWGLGARGLRYCWSSGGVAWAAGARGCTLGGGLWRCRFCCLRKPGTTAVIVDWLLHRSNSMRCRPLLRVVLENRGGEAAAVCMSELPE